MEVETVCEANVFLLIAPGIQIQSGYRDEVINSLSRKIIRLALALAILQILITLAHAIVVKYVESLIFYILNIAIYLGVFYIAIQCVKSKNAPICCNCCRTLSLYRTYLYITATLLLISIVLAVYQLFVDYALYLVVGVIIDTTLFGLNVAEIYYSTKLIKILSQQVHNSSDDVEV